MSDDVFNGDMLRIPVVGRKFTLGTLYDARSATAVTDDSVCNEIASEAFKTTRNDGATFSIICSDKLSDKLDDLGVEDWHRITIWTEDTVQRQASFKYLKKKKTAFHQCSVHVRCHYYTATRELMADLSEKGQLRRHRQTTATHVTTQIQYGAEATFTLRRKLDETDDEHGATSLLQDCARKLMDILNGKADVIDTSTSTDIECQLEGDFLLPITFATYQEVVQFAPGFVHLLSKSIPKVVIDGNESSLGIPCIAWLHPLASTTEDKENPIDHHVLAQYVQQIDDYDELESQLDYLLDHPLAMKLCPLIEKLKVFQHHFLAFRNEYRTDLNRLIQTKGDQLSLPLWRRVDDDQFAFNRQRLASWLREKDKELRTMMKCHDFITHNDRLDVSERVLLFPTAQQLQQFMTNYPVNFGFELTFSCLWYDEPCLRFMAHREFNPAHEEGDRQPALWYQNPAMMRRIEKEMTIFGTFIRSKRNDDKFAFALTALRRPHRQVDGFESFLFVHQQAKQSCGWKAIEMACQHYPKGDLIDIVRLLCDHDADADAIEIADSWHPFLGLCRFYDDVHLIDVIRLFLERGVDLTNCKTDDGWNALLLVCRYYTGDNLLDVSRLLLARGVDVNGRTDAGLNGLHLVCRYYDQTDLNELVRLFFERGLIDVDGQLDDGWNAFLFLCRNYHRDNLLGIVRFFLAQKRRINVNAQTKGGNNALLFLCRYYNQKNLLETIRLLLDRGVHVNNKNNEGWNALYLVCRYYERDNLIDIVRLLLQRNIDVNCVNSQGWNALHLLCRYYQRDNLIGLLRLLLDQNMEINCKTDTGCNVLHNVCRYYQHDNLIDIVRLLLDSGVFASFTNNEGGNALLNLCRYYPHDNLIDLVQLFLDRGIDVNWANNQGWNALHFICRYYQQDNLVDIVQLLLHHDIDVNSQTDDGCNALHFVARRYDHQTVDSIETVQLLLANGISVHDTNQDGYSALHNVCRYQRKKKMMELIPLLMADDMKTHAPPPPPPTTTIANQIEKARTILLSRYKQENVKEILQMLDSKR